ncbi:MAG: M50 family metallopeptidase [Bacillota bacterium]
MTLINWLWAIPVFGLLIFIHELGHFAVAKFFDIRVHEFALGFGPVLWGFDRGETRYNLRAIPLGGFVRMSGMDETEADDPRGFNRKPLLARALVLFAGPFMNFVLASVMLSTLLYVQGGPNPASVLGQVITDCPVVVDGQATTRPCPAAVAGLKAGDKVVAINNTPVDEWVDILAVVRDSEGKPLLFKVQRGGEVAEVTVAPIYSEGRYMVGILQGTQRGSFGQALVQGPVITYNYSRAWLSAMGDTLTGKQQVELSGPVGIVREIATQASERLINLLGMTAILSINLGLFNLIPFPPLDGARLVLLGVELVRGRRLDPQRENMVHFIGMMVLLGLIVVVTYGDIFGR